MSRFVEPMSGSSRALDQGGAEIPQGTRGIGDRRHEGHWRRSVAGAPGGGYSVAATYAGNTRAAEAFAAGTGIRTYQWDIRNFDDCAAGVRPSRQRSVRSTFSSTMP